MKIDDYWYNIISMIQKKKKQKQGKKEKRGKKKKRKKDFILKD